MKWIRLRELAWFKIKTIVNYANYAQTQEITMTTIVDIAVNNEGFSTLVTAVSAASLVEALQSPGPFTVFAPNDAAFAKLPPGTITTLVQNIPQLARILTDRKSVV